MPQYQAYPNKKNTPSRLTRKQQRSKLFVANKAAGIKLRKARKAERDARLEAAEENVGG